MATRTSNHILEDESRHFFQSILPKAWVYRDKDKDYGIDSEVEIFDDHGQATGLVFWVQLKGTASNDPKVIKSLTFKNEKLSQFINYDIPVLIVRYSSIHKSIYIKWAKSIYKLNRESQRTKIMFTDSEKFVHLTSQYILAYLKNQASIKQGNVRFPVKTHVGLKPSDTFLSPYSRVIFIKNYLSIEAKYFELTNQEDDALLNIYIDGEILIFSFKDLAFSTLRFNFDMFSNFDEKALSYIKLTFCSCLFELGRKDLGSDVFFKENLFNVACQDSSYLAGFLHHLLIGPNFERTMRLLINHLANDEQKDNFIEIVTNIILVASREDFDDEKLNLTEEFLLLNLVNAGRTNFAVMEGTACYNLANFYRGINKYELSYAYYVKAKKHKPVYKTNSYFYDEVAGLMFLLRKYGFATMFYEKSQELGSDSLLINALLADCLMYTGKYGLAAKKLDEFLNENYDKEIQLHEWYLKYTCLTTLIDNGYLSSQIRNSNMADLLAADGNYDGAISFDMLCELAWFNKGVVEAKAENITGAFIAFVMTGLLNSNDVLAWANATMLGLNDNIDRILLIYVIQTAYYYNRQNYIILVYDLLDKTNFGRKDIIMELIDKTLPKLERKPVTIRMF